MAYNLIYFGKILNPSMNQTVKQTIFIFAQVLVMFLSGIHVFAQCGDCEYQSENLVSNGDFSAGNTGFTTDYALATVNGPWGLLSFEGNYVIDNNASNAHQFFQGLDHTNPPFGDYMIVNGSSIPSTNVWCQTITVQPNTWYSFSAWVRNVDTNPGNTVYAQLQFNINGAPLGPEETVSGGWQQIAEDWFSGTETSIDICLVNQQTNAGGNDFGLDDITFTTCLAYDIVNLPSAGLDQTVCSGDIVTLGEVALTDISYNWTGQGVDGSNEANPQTVLLNDQDVPVDFTFSFTADSAFVGCVLTDEVTITVNPNPEPDFGENIVICEGEETFLDAGDTWESVSWNTNEATNGITVSQAGNYTATVTLLGCEGSDTWTINTPVLPSFNLGPDTSICVDETFIFNAGVNGIWSDNSTDLTLETNQEGWYWFEVEEQGCTERDSVFLDVIQYPNVDLPDSLFLCPGEQVTLYTEQSGFWSNGSTADSLMVSTEGEYSVLLNNQQCTVSDDVFVTQLNFPEVDLGNDQLLCQRDVVRLSAFGAYNDSVLWSDGNTEFLRDINETGVYEVNVWNVCDTVSDAVELVFEDCDYALYIPNALTPDGDGLNENWCPVGLNLTSIEIQLFNRWGELVWESTTLGECWIGNKSFGSYYVPNDVYAYRIVAETIQGEKILRNGSVTVLR